MNRIWNFAREFSKYYSTYRYAKGGPPTHSSFERVCMQLHPPPNAMPVMEAPDHGLLLETQRNPKSIAASGQHGYRAHSIY